MSCASHHSDCSDLVARRLWRPPDKHGASRRSAATVNTYDCADAYDCADRHNCSFGDGDSDECRGAVADRCTHYDQPANQHPLPAAQGTGAIVHGTITYPADPALPDAAVLSVKLMPGTRTFFYPDVSEPLGEQRISPVRPGVVPFAIEYDPDAIDPLLPYTLVAQLDASGKRYFMGGAEVITNNQPSKVNIQLHPHPTATAVTGIVTYPSDRPLPPDSLLTIRLQTPVDGVGGPHVLGE